MGSYNRRNGIRIPTQMVLTEYLRDEPRRCMTFDVSETGLYVNRLLQPKPLVHRPGQVVGLEFELPGTGETVWARGEVMFDRTDEFFHGTGIQFTGMANMHQRLVRDYVLDQQARHLHDLLAKIRRNRKILPN